MKKVKQYFCYALYYIFAVRFPKSNARISLCSRRIRCVLVKNFIDRCGKNVNIQKGAIVPRDFSIGDNSGVGINCLVQSGTVIGDNVMMGPEVFIYTKNHRHDRTDIPMIQQGFDRIDPVTIKNDVWIGYRVIILPGVTINEGTVVGAGAVVAHDTPPYSVVAGNPAKVVKMRQ